MVEINVYGSKIHELSINALTQQWVVLKFECNSGSYLHECRIFIKTVISLCVLVDQIDMIVFILATCVQMHEYNSGSNPHE